MLCRQCNLNRIIRTRMIEFGIKCGSNRWECLRGRKRRLYNSGLLEQMATLPHLLRERSSYGFARSAMMLALNITITITRKANWGWHYRHWRRQNTSWTLPGHLRSTHWLPVSGRTVCPWSTCPQHRSSAHHSWPWSCWQRRSPSAHPEQMVLDGH